MSDNKNKSTSLNNMIYCGIGAIIVIIFFVWLHENTDDTSNDRNIDAWVCAQNAVQEELKSPSSADFCTYPEATIKDRGNDKYSITGWVDADNSFGANIRTDFTVKLTLTSKGYKDAQCYFGDDSLWAIAEDVVNEKSKVTEEDNSDSTKEYIGELIDEEYPEKDEMIISITEKTDIKTEALMCAKYLDKTFEELGLNKADAQYQGKNQYKIGEINFLGEMETVFLIFSSSYDKYTKPTKIRIGSSFFDFLDLKQKLEMELSVESYYVSDIAFYIEIPDTKLYINCFDYTEGTIPLEIYITDKKA